jgi:hypothetical protein
MDEKTKSALDKLFAEDKQRKAKADAREDERHTREAAFLADFIRVRESIIEPAMSEIANYVTEQGWSTEIKTQDERHEVRGNKTINDRAQISLLFARPGKGKPFALHLSPHFTAICDKPAGKVLFLESTVGEGHGGSSGVHSSATLVEITRDLFHERIATYMAKLMKDSRPYGER